jgi:glutamate decarboxylase
MVHLAAVKRDSENIEPLVKRVDSIKLETTEDDGFYSTVYGTRFAAEQLPQTEMPEKEMPREVAYRMIKDELSLDGNPMLKYVELLEWSCGCA